MSDARAVSLENVGTYVALYTRDRCWSVAAEEEPRIDAAVSELLASNRTRDSLLDLTSVTGIAVKVLASECVAWEVSTPAGRLAEEVREKQELDEYRYNRKAAGFADDAEEAWKEAT